PDVTDVVDRANTIFVGAVGTKHSRPARHGGERAAVVTGFEMVHATRDASDRGVVASERDNDDVLVGQGRRLRRDRRDGPGVIDEVAGAGEVAVAQARAGQRGAVGGADDRVVVDETEADRAVAGEVPDRYGINGAAAGHLRDAPGGRARRRDGKVADVDSGDC